MRSSKRRLYLNLRKSFIELFKSRERWLKETVGKESIFDKPYLDEDYRAMHLRLPTPRWESAMGAEPGGEKTLRKHFLFPPPKVSVWVFSPVQCGVPFTISAFVTGMIFGDLHAQFSWSIESATPELEILSMQPDARGKHVDFLALVREPFEGEIFVIVSATTKSELIKAFSVTYTVPAWAMEWGYQYTLAPKWQQGFKAPMENVFGEEWYPAGTVLQEGHSFNVECTPPDPCAGCMAASIGFTTQGMDPGTSQTLTIENRGSVPLDCFTWENAGGGSISSDTGESITYYAPSTNSGCNNNGLVYLKCGDKIVSSLSIAIRSLDSTIEAYEIALPTTYYDAPYGYIWGFLERDPSGPKEQARPGVSYYDCSYLIVRPYLSYDCRDRYRRWNYCAARSGGVGSQNKEHKCYDLFFPKVAEVDAECSAKPQFVDRRPKWLIDAGCCPAGVL